jgi:pyruvate dehydrogenase E2 component (dihydrolipoamide acetyltransferase)
MAVVINMPRLSDTMEEGTVASWLKKVGDTVKEGDILAEIETDKATMEFESFNAGTLLHIGIEAGKTAPVDALLAIIGAPGEDISAYLSGAPAVAESTPAPAAETAQTAAPSSAPAAVPQGVQIITMPRLSDTMEVGTVATWLKKVGDAVKEGDMLAEIETDKATMEFESFYAGTLLHIGLQAGESAPVDSVLAIIGPQGTDVSALISGAPAPAPVVASAEPVAVAATASVSAPVVASAAVGSRILASPLAKKMAADQGIDLALVQGSGEFGRIVKADIEKYTPAAVAAPQASVAHVALGVVHSEGVKNSQMRKVIAKRLSASKFSAPHYYLTIEVDMEEAMASRVQINTMPDTKVSFNDMVLKATAMALVKHPQVNTSWQDEQTIYHQHVHMGVAVAVEDGLVVPVIPFADRLGLTQIGGAVKDLAGKARSKKLTPQEMEGSTFTVSNLGMFGVQEFTSIINQPNSAILSVGAIVEKPVVKNGQIVVGHTMKLTLACDHRTVDGATGAQFLQTLQTYLEHPVTMLA